MGTQTASDMTVELMRRITQLSQPDALAAINAAIRYINRQGSFTFQNTGHAAATVGADGTLAVPTDMDTGKAHVITDVDSGLPISKVGIQDLSIDGVYPIVSTLKMLSCYAIKGREFYFRPVLGSTRDVTIDYHVVTVDIIDDDTSNLPKEFDDLIVDYAEARERRIYDVGSVWVQVLAQVQDQIKVMLDGYRSSSLEPEPGSEAQAAAIEKAQIGRA